MNVRVLAFARVREVLGFADRCFDVEDAATLGDLRDMLEADVPTLKALRLSTRSACNGELSGDGTVLRDGDEVALLPPVGGG